MAGTFVMCELLNSVDKTDCIPESSSTWEDRSRSRMPDIPTASPPREAYYVVVSGAMNTQIHHPQWYRIIGAIDEAELQASLRNPTNFTGAALSVVQFGAPALTVTCQPGAWWIHSSDANQWARMIDVTALVFARLKETPVTAYGFTSQLHIDTVAPDTKSVLAESILGMKLGFPGGSGKSAGSNIALTVTDEDAVVNTSIQPSILSERAIFLNLNCQYSSPTAAAPGYFDLGVLLKGRFERYRALEQRVCTDMLAGVNSLAEAKKSL